MAVPAISSIQQESRAAPVSSTPKISRISKTLSGIVQKIENVFKQVRKFLGEVYTRLASNLSSLKERLFPTPATVSSDYTISQASTVPESPEPKAVVDSKSSFAHANIHAAIGAALLAVAETGSQV